MEEYIKWLENKIEVCLKDKDLQREHWAFCQALKKYRELALHQPTVSGRSEQLKAFLSTMIEEFDKGGVSWETRDSAESLLKSL
jgi:hypothetical protein